MATERLKVGTAQTTINPSLGMQIDGNIGAYRPAECIVNDLCARVVVFEQGRKRFMLLVMDLLAITAEWTEAIRSFASSELGFEHDAVAVHVTQNHSSPSLGHIMLTDRTQAAKKYPWLRGSDPAYGPMVLEKLKPIMRQATANTQPVHLLCATALENRVAFNRRYVMRDGTAQMGLGPKPENVSHCEGPMDPEVGLALFATDDLKPQAALLHHTCHPVHWDPHRAIHSDWPGAWARRVQQTIFPGATPLVINGCCGNVIHHDALNPHREDTPESMAVILTQAIVSALNRPHFRDDAPHLAYKTVRIGLPFRAIEQKVFDDAHAFLAAHPEPTWQDETRTRCDWDWPYAASLVDLEALRASQKEFEYEIQAIRLGDLALLVLPGEPFVEGQLEIKHRSPAQRTFIAHMSNHYVGYIPTPSALARGGYEADASIGSKLAPEALQMVVDKAVEVLEALWGEEGVI